jgi:hypothetical protein
LLPVADYLYRSGKGVFYPPKTTKGKKKEGKCGEKGKKCGKKKGKKTKGGKKKDRKRQRAKWKKHKFSPTSSQAPGFRDTKNARSERRQRFGLKAERPYLAVIGLRL